MQQHIMAGLAALLATIFPVPAMASDDPMPRGQALAPNFSACIEGHGARLVLPLIAGRPGAAYLALENCGDAMDRLIAVRATGIERIEIHGHVLDGTVMRMRRLDGVDLAAATMTAFEERGRHLMLFGVDADIQPGDEVMLTLTFAAAGSFPLAFRAEKRLP